MKGEVIRRRKLIIVRRYKQIPRENGYGMTTDFDNYTDTEHDIELEIDIDGLFAQLGDKAARSKGGKAVEAGGLIKARRRS